MKYVHFSFKKERGNGFSGWTLCYMQKPLLTLPQFWDGAHADWCKAGTEHLKTLEG